MGIRANRQSIPNVSTNPWSRERCSLSASNGCIYSPTGPLGRFRRVARADTSKSFPRHRRDAHRCIDPRIPEVVDPPQSRTVVSAAHRLGRPRRSSHLHKLIENPIISRRISVVCDGRFRYWAIPSSESALRVR